MTYLEALTYESSWYLVYDRVASRAHEHIKYYTHKSVRLQTFVSIDSRVSGCVDAQLSFMKIKHNNLIV